MPIYCAARPWENMGVVSTLIGCRVGSSVISIRSEGLQNFSRYGWYRNVNLSLSRWWLVVANLLIVGWSFRLEILPLRKVEEGGITVSCGYPVWTGLDLCGVCLCRGWYGSFLLLCVARRRRGGKTPCRPKYSWNLILLYPCRQIRLPCVRYLLICGNNGMWYARVGLRCAASHGLSLFPRIRKVG